MGIIFKKRILLFCIVFILNLVSAQNLDINNIKIKNKFKSIDIQISYGDEDLAEHPYQLFYNIDDLNLNWCTIAYVPKTLALRRYWKKYILKNYNQTLSQFQLKKYLEKRKNDFYIFAVIVNKKFIDTSNGSSFEAIFFKNEVVVETYILQQKKWKYEKSIRIDVAKTISNDFFLKNFPTIFKY